MRSRQIPIAALLALGFGWMGLSQLLAGGPTAPLFDGLVVEDPYRFVEPPPGGATDPFSASAIDPVDNGSAPLVAIATDETPPQAQLIAQADAFVIVTGTTSIAVSIEPLAPTDPRVAGNVYRFGVTDQAGAALAIVPDALVTIVLRAPQPDPGAVLGHLEGGQWVPLPTDHGGLPDLLAANVGQLGDFAVLRSAAAASASATASTSVVGTASPAASPGSGGTQGGAGFPTWAIALLAIAAVGAGLVWGLVVRGEDADGPGSDS
jgi:hypothetical protein